MLEAVAEEEVTVAPVPKVRTVEQTTTPTYPEAKDAPKKRQAAVEPKAEPEPQAEQPKKERQAAAGGSGGADEADSAASAQSGGKGASSAAAKAATDKYPSQVQARLRRALRFPKNAKGAEGEVHVRFVVAANGGASQISVVRSSGSSALDDAAIATVKRAAPFPPIPEGAGKSSWTFTMPLLFQQ
jgi:protein TonB